MTRTALADAFDAAAEALAQVAHELRASEQPASAGVPSSVPTPAVSAAGAPPPAPAAPSSALGKCPKHGIPWSVKEGGVSRAGKAYSAFWKCNEKDPAEERGYCQQKPDFGWAKTHPAERALVAAADEVPF